jgi:hypothetical protein
MKSKSASETGKILNVTKNSVLGALYREKVKNGYVPPADSKYTSEKSRGVKSTSFYSRGKKIGKRPCNICNKMFDMHGRFDRFCSTCRRNLPYA